MKLCYRPQQSCGKIMFLHLCVINVTGGHEGSLSGVFLSRGVSIQGSLSWGVSVQGVIVHWDLCLWGSLSGGLCLGGMVACRRYASYWNAFLFNKCIYGKPHILPKLYSRVPHWTNINLVNIMQNMHNKNLIMIHRYCH